MAVFNRIAALALESLVILLEVGNIFHEVWPEGIPSHNVKDFDFVVRRLLVVRGAFLNFQSHVSIVMRVPGEPDCRKVAPAELLNDDVPVDHDFANVHRVVATNLVVRDTFVLTHVTVCEEFTF